MYLIKKLKEEAKKPQVSVPVFDLASNAEAITKSINESTYAKTLKDCQAVDGLFYLESYVDSETCDRLLGMIRNQPSETWVILKHANRRLQKWGN